MCKEGWCTGLGQEGKNFEEGGGKLGQGVVALKGGGFESLYELCASS